MTKDERDPLAVGVGNAVRAGRKAAGQTQEELAAELEVSAITLSNIERGQNAPTLGVFLRLVRVLKLDPIKLATGQASTRRVSDERKQLEAEGDELLRSADLRDLKLLIGLAKAMQGK